MSRLIVITGPSGVGKGTLIKRLRETMPQIAMSVSATTRKPRAGEREGVDYHFMSEAEFDEAVAGDAFLEHAEYSGHRYGTPRAEVEGRDTPVVLEIEVQGARQVRQAAEDALLVFIAPPDPETLEERLRVRGTDAPEAVARRLETARMELAAQDEFQHVIVNDDLDVAAADLESVVRRGLSLHSRAE
jgi:guanylate kinase